MKYVSRKDWWLTIIVWASMLFSIISCMYAVFSDNPGTGDLIIMVLLGILLPLFLLWLWLTTCYVLTDTELVVQFGPFKKAIPLERIISVKKTSNPLSSPALSLKRLEISYGGFGQFILISPKDRDEFIQQLKKKCPNLVIK